MREVCSRCGRIWPWSSGWRWRCACGGLLDLAGTPPAGPVDLGMAPTPLAAAGGGRWVKADFEMPTGSFKDRGASTMIGAAVAGGARAVVSDSSGNAGRSVAAHASAARLDCRVYVPSGTAFDKMSAIASYGAEVVEVAGDRAAAAAAAQREASAGAWYASHVHQPSFHHGVKTLAFELAAQLPDPQHTAVVVPAGNGTLVIGLWLGFSELAAAGHLPGVPPVVAVQAEACAPLAGRPPVGATAASGIAVARPPRAAQVRAAVAASGGWVLTVGEEAIARACRELAGLGFDVEPTGAVAWAALGGVPLPAVAVLTGRR